MLYKILEANWLVSKKMWIMSSLLVIKTIWSSSIYFPQVSCYLKMIELNYKCHIYWNVTFRIFIIKLKYKNLNCWSYLRLNSTLIISAETLKFVFRFRQDQLLEKRFFLFLSNLKSEVFSSEKQQVELFSFQESNFLREQS